MHFILFPWGCEVHGGSGHRSIPRISLAYTRWMKSCDQEPGRTDGRTDVSPVSSSGVVPWRGWQGPSMIQGGGGGPHTGRNVAAWGWLEDGCRFQHGITLLAHWPISGHQRGEGGLQYTHLGEPTGQLEATSQLKTWLLPTVSSGWEHSNRRTWQDIYPGLTGKPLPPLSHPLSKKNTLANCHVSPRMTKYFKGCGGFLINWGN